MQWNTYTNRPQPSSQRLIHYVNAFPGSGKTWRFIHDVAVPHVQQCNDTVLVYAAPTERLLNEVEHKLIKAGVSNKKLWRVSSQDSDEGPVAERLITLLVGSLKHAINPVPNGTIILCTHECIARIPLDAPGRNRVSLVYDEARACLQDNYSIRLPEAVYDYLTQNVEDDYGIVLAPVKEALAYKDKECTTFIWQWRSYNTPPPDEQYILSLLPKSPAARAQAIRINGFIQNVYSSSIDVYVSVHKERRKGKTEYLVNNVFSPGRMFRGYQRVLILSAYFESSQMYHFLNSPLATSLDQYPTTLVNVTSKYIKIERLHRLVHRLQKTYITYVYPGRSELSKTDIHSGLSVFGNLDANRVQQISQQWSTLFTKRPESLRSAFYKYQKSKGGAQRASTKNRVAIEAFFQRLTKSGLQPESVVTHMVKTSMQLYSDFLTLKKLPVIPLPVGINPRYVSNSTYGNSVWETENLDALNKAGMPPIVPVSMVSHGLNKYRNMNGCAFLASMKYSPNEFQFLKRTIPSYDPTLDRTLDYAIQVLWRCSVRNTDTTDPCLLIVTDETLAHALQEKFLKDIPKKYRSKALRILAPELISPSLGRHDILKYTPPYDSKRKRVINKRHRQTDGARLENEMRKLYYNNTGYGRLTAQISYYRKQQNADMVDTLLKQRKELSTFAEWRRTPEGLNAWDSLQNTRGHVPSTKLDQVRTIITNPKIWEGSRNTRLGIILALKELGFRPEQVTTYPGKGLHKNWNGNRRWKKGNPAAYILHVADTNNVSY